jgi:ribonucleotide monophosphatase NagD (HAD superfamily)
MASGIGNTSSVTTDTTAAMLDQLSSVVAQNQAFQSAMRTADNINTQESMKTSLTINANTGQRKGLDTSVEAQNQDFSKRPQGIQQLYRQ